LDEAIGRFPHLEALARPLIAARPKRHETIGLIGGMSWESTAQYYDLINREIAFTLGASHSARCLVYSFDFQEIEELQYAGEWGELRRACSMWPRLSRPRGPIS
jgi:hypothetical protein